MILETDPGFENKTKKRFCFCLKVDKEFKYKHRSKKQT